MKKRWLFVTLSIGVLALGITAGVTLAEGERGGADSAFKSFFSRVATILGLDEAQVQDAFYQAARETRDEPVQSELDRLVAQERITREQADEYLGWFQARPEGFRPGFHFRGSGGHGFFGGRMFGSHHRHGMKFFEKAPDGSSSGATEPSSS